jgi:hypothetical protein
MMLTKEKKYTSPQQLESLRQSPLIVESGKPKIGINWFSFEFQVQPTVYSRQYLLRISYSLSKSPKIIVLEPKLSALANNRRLPHVYCQDPAQLCLYLPGSGEWSSDRLISKTILPWSILWLYYFEHWLVTDQWEGGGEHPQVKPNNNKKGKN